MPEADGYRLDRLEESSADYSLAWQQMSTVSAAPAIGMWQAWKNVPDSNGWWVCWNEDTYFDPFMIYVIKETMPRQRPGSKFLRIHSWHTEKVQQLPREVPVQRTSLW